LFFAVKGVGDGMNIAEFSPELSSAGNGNGYNHSGYRDQVSQFGEGQGYSSHRPFTRDASRSLSIRFAGRCRLLAAELSSLPPAKEGLSWRPG
jgi:hypothetical protein